MWNLGLKQTQRFVLGAFGRPKNGRKPQNDPNLRGDTNGAAQHGSAPENHGESETFAMAEDLKAIAVGEKSSKKKKTYLCQKKSYRNEVHVYHFLPASFKRPG